MQSIASVTHDRAQAGYDTRLGSGHRDEDGDAGRRDNTTAFPTTRLSGGGFGKIFHNPFPMRHRGMNRRTTRRMSSGYSQSNQERLVKYREQMRADGSPADAVERMRGPATEIQEQPDDKNFDGKQTATL